MVPRVTTPTEEQTLMRLNLGAGYWVVRRPCADWITGVAPTVEAHYTTTLENAKITSGAAPLSFNPPTFFVSNFGNLANRIDVVDLTLGGTVEIGDRATFAAGFVIPLSSGKNKPFDFELNLQLNYRFGVQTRASRSQF
jgi:hypothetical protein